MKTNKPKDERIEQLTGVVCRRGFKLLSLGIALDLMGKLALWRPGLEGLPFFPAVGLEALVLLAALVYVMGAAARQGVPEQTERLAQRQLHAAERNAYEKREYRRRGKCQIRRKAKPLPAYHGFIFFWLRPPCHWPQRRQ